MTVNTIAYLDEMCYNKTDKRKGAEVMPRFFIRQNKIENEYLTIDGTDARHIARALRMAVGDEITVCDMQGNEYSCVITSFLDDAEVRARIVSVKSSENEP